MKIKTIAILILLIVLSKLSSAQSSEIKVLKEKVLIGKEGVDYWVYQYSNIVSDSEMIKLWNRKISSPFKKSILFLIDDEPFANWTHPCRYIFMDKSNVNSYKIISETSPPTNFEKFSLLTEISLPTGYKYDFSNIKKDESSSPSLKSAISPGDASYGYKYAVIISGGYNKSSNYERYWNDCSAIYSTLRHVYGFEQHQVFVLMSDGNDTGADMNSINGGYVDSPKDLDGDGVGDIHNMATKQAVISLFDMLGDWMLPNDYLYIFTTDHGSLESGNDVKICLWNEQEMRDDEFATQVDKINAGKISIVMEQCHSGGFVDDLSGNGRIIATACQANEYSYATTDLLYNEFVFHWTAAVLGEYPDGTVANADNNNDGFVTMLEAFEYARDNDSRDETPQYNSQPQTLGQELTNFGFEVNSSLQNITINSGDEQKHYAYNITAADNGTSYNVKNGGKNYLKAGNNIVLESNFTAELGSEFYAIIEPFSIPVLNVTSSVKSTSVKFENQTPQEVEIENNVSTDLLEDVSIYPNPSNGLFYFINKNQTQTQIAVYNSKGNLLINESIPTNKGVINLLNQPTGVYFLKIHKNNEIITKKMIKR